MKNGDIFYTFDEITNLIKRMVFTEMETKSGHVFAVEITGTTTYARDWFPQSRVFKTHEEAFEALKRRLKRQYELELNAAEEDYKRMYGNEVKE